MADETNPHGSSGQPRPGYRGKCLYKTGKCNNERALKTSGQSHNLCDEHRHRQNEHQRKLDAKNRFARKDKRSPGSGKDDSPTNAMDNAAGAARGSHGHRYAPYGKMRMSPNGASVAGVDDMHAMLGRNGMIATPAMAQSMMQFHALGVDGANALAAAHMAGGAGMPAGSPEILPSGVVILPNGPQAPQMPYPSPMQDFDGIVVPLPSYLEGHERVEFRSRIYQKVLDFIAEECMRRFGAVPTSGGPMGSASTPLQPVPMNVMNGAAAAPSDRRDELSSGVVNDVAKTAAGQGRGAAESQEPSGDKMAATTAPPQPGVEKDNSDDAEPEDADENGGDEEEEAPRSKRPTRSRVVRKEVQSI